MNKQITQVALSILIGFLFLVPAQAQDNTTDGPSIAETVDYINKVVSASLGVRINPESESDDRWVITKQEFSLAKVFQEDKNYAGYIYEETVTNFYENISWETMGVIKEKKAGSLIELEIDFELPVFNSYAFSVSSDLNWSGPKKTLEIYVLPEKSENVKKALLHLKKLMYKEDPFGD